MHQMQTAKAVHPLLRKWWMRTRAIKASITAEGIGGAAELYCPLWAKPLDWLHGALCGGSKLSLA
jgi:hypothetical protein